MFRTTIILIIPLSLLLASCGQSGDLGQVKLGIRQYDAGDLNESIETMSDVLLSSPECAACLEYRGFAYKDIGQYEKAIEDFNAHIQLDTTRSAGYINRASVFYLKTDYPKALRDFQKALELDPENTGLYNPIAHMLFETGQKDEACAFYQKALDNGDSEFAGEIKAHCRGK